MRLRCLCCGSDRVGTIATEAGVDRSTLTIVRALPSASGGAASTSSGFPRRLLLGECRFWENRCGVLGRVGNDRDGPGVDGSTLTAVDGSTFLWTDSLLQGLIPFFVDCSSLWCAQGPLGAFRPASCGASSIPPFFFVAEKRGLHCLAAGGKQAMQLGGQGKENKWIPRGP